MVCRNVSHSRDVLGKSKEFLDYFGRGLGGTVAALYSAPTAVRKFANNQLMFVENKDSHSKAECMGYGLGFFTGASIDSALFAYTAEQVGKENYIPALVLGLSNLAFGAVESIRFFRNKRKNQKKVLESL